MKSGSGLKQNPIVQTVLGVQKRYSTDGAGYMAAVLSYYGFLSLFPLILVIVSVLGFFLAGDPAYQAKLTLRIAEAIPGLAEAAGKNIGAIVRRRTSLGAFGLLALVWAGVGAVEAARFTLGRIFRVEENLSFFKKKGSALVSLATIGSAALVSVALATVIGGIRAQGGAGIALKASVIAGTFALDLLVFLAAYRTLTPKRGPKFRDLWQGALLAAIGWTALKIFGGWYIRRSVEGATASFGTFATVVGLLALLYLVARLFVYGAELNAFQLEKGTMVVDPRKKVGPTRIPALVPGKADPGRPGKARSKP